MNLLSSYKTTCNIRPRHFTILCLLVLCLLVIKTKAQYNFIRYDSSRVVFGKDSSAFMKLYGKMDDLKNGKRDRVTIVHYGGSHIQAGFWSEKLIDNFQALGNFEGGGVWAFPYKIAKTNGPPFYRSFSDGRWKRCRCALAKEMCPNLGMNGIAAVTNDSATNFGVKITTNNHHKNFNTVKVYHNFNASFEISLGEQAGLPSKRSDDKSKGYTEFTFENYIDSINFQLIRKDTLQRDFMLYGISLENNKPGYYYAGFGVNGASSSSFLRCPLLVDQLKTLKPDLVIFSLGVNDTQGKDFTKADFIAHYDSLIALIKKASPDCAILFTTTSDNYIARKTPNKRPIRAEEAMYDLMQKHKAAVWDLYEVMGGYRSIYKWYKSGLAAKDKVHFNSRGYYIVGQLMFEALERSYRYNSKVGK
ncbi:MAG: hypothetical protein JST26_03475 [Bacteroidetes bacterium]|nr:hypothetical protein [Bacteroidota bacterium]